MKKLLLIFVFFLLAPQAHAALAFDKVASSSVGIINGTKTVYTNFAVASNNSLVVVFTLQGDLGTENVTGVTFNGTAMTQLDKVQVPRWGAWGYSYGLYVATAVTGDVQITGNATDNNMRHTVIAYSGVDATNAYGANTVATQAGGTPLTNALTTTYDGSWIVSMGVDDGAAVTGSTNAGTPRITSSFVGVKVADSGGSVGAAGSHDVTWTGTNVDAVFAVEVHEQAVAALQTFFAPLLQLFGNW